MGSAPSAEPLAPKRDDDSVVVAILVYKAVNKAAPSQGAARITTLVLRRPSAAPLRGRRHRGAHHEPPQRQRAILDGRRLFSFGDVAPCHGPRPWTPTLSYTLLYRAPGLLLRRHVVTLPAKILGEEAQDAYKKRRRATVKRIRSILSESNLEQ